MRMSLVAAVIAGLTTIAPVAHAVEEPPHTVMEKDGRFEIRSYAPMIVASVEVAASRGKAPNAGFEPLAEYIFGANRASEKIEMTAPVVQSRSQKIDMTAPVTQTPSANGSWTISFVMPAKWTMETLPRPENPAVILSQTPARTMAVIRFSGTGGPDAQQEKQADLERWIAGRGWRIAGEPSVAFYDPPWTLPPFRRNEVMIPVERAT